MNLPSKTAAREEEEQGEEQEQVAWKLVVVVGVEVRTRLEVEVAARRGGRVDDATVNREKFSVAKRFRAQQSSQQ